MRLLHYLPQVYYDLIIHTSVGKDRKNHIIFGKVEMLSSNAWAKIQGIDHNNATLTIVIWQRKFRMVFVYHPKTGWTRSIKTVAGWAKGILSEPIKFSKIKSLPMWDELKSMVERELNENK